MTASGTTLSLFYGLFGFLTVCCSFVGAFHTFNTLEDYSWDEVPQSCSSPIYCYGPLLHTVQISGIFNDSKHFVDMTMLYDQQTILENFEEFMRDTDNNPTKSQITKFVMAHFQMQPELEPWTPPDFNPQPAFLSQITDQKIRKFATNLINLWPKLGRKISQSVLDRIDRHSLLPLTEGFIVPGGRFRETYYWDSYWIIKGLLLSDMTDTARGMLNNFVMLIKRYGFIPNGARVYYTCRTQPPLFTAMVKAYFDATKDRKWLKANLRYVEQELKFWLEKRTVVISKNGTNYKMARYLPESEGPRPESYKEDYQTASAFPAQRQRIYVDLKGGAESGWDFSTRWLYSQSGSNEGNISSIYTRRNIPVDLNSFLYKAFDSYSDLAFTIGRSNSARFWLNEAIKLRTAIKEVLWNEEVGIWFDYDLLGRRHRTEFYISNLAPLYSNAQHTTFRADKLINYLENLSIFEFPGGTPSSLQHSGEQWDYPNAWPPLQAIMVQSLAKCQSPLAQSLAKKLAVKWISANLKGYEESGVMFEKYSALEAGKRGGGGEYEVQAGFGWTNGIALELINQYYANKT